MEEMKFKILVENEFVYNEDPNELQDPINIRWTFLKDGEPLSENYIPYYRKEKPLELEQVQQVPPGIMFELSEGEFVEITVEEAPHMQCGKKKHLWWMKLPMRADFLFLSREGKNVPIPIASVSRVPEGDGCGDERIRVYFPPDPSTWKLRIGRPGSIKENYQPEYLQRGALLMNGDDTPPDNVSLGSNGEG